ncbi:ankyrin and armadillo repeat-containing protein-like isoform X2 [Ascaphus truei]|uniref:ankyrin and armadillo repeat-containing protein-like isoform X2 n=1 Tax=Ascaphus truei TaxID=8439 RepID=UPI003F5A28D4
MEELDENGWAPMHHAAYRNHVSLVERLVETSGPGQLETRTGDNVQNTPLLIAASCGSQDMVNLLVNLGANIAFVNRQSHGVIEICALHGHLDLLRYFLHLCNPKLNVCKRLVALLDSDSEEDILRACSVICELVNQSVGVMNCHIYSFLAEGLVSGLLNVLRKHLVDDVKKQALNVLQNIVRNGNVKRQISENDGFQVLVSLVLNGSRQLLSGLVDAICELASEKNFAEAHSANIIPALMKVVSNADKENREDILLPALRAMDFLATVSPICKDAIGKQAGLLRVLVRLFKECRAKPLLITWGDTVGSIAEENTNNQNIFISENVGSHLNQMLKSQHKEVQMSAVKSLHRVVEGNLNAQKTIMESNGMTPLIHLLKRSQSQHSQEAVAETLWALAGVETETQRTVAARIGVHLLVELLGSHSYKLHLVGIKGLSVLVRGPYDLRNAVASANGGHHLVQLLRSPSEDVVLRAIQALQHICLCVGYIPHRKNQTAVANSRGLKFLTVLMTHSQSEFIQVEAALAIAAVVLGNSGNLDQLCKDSGFSYAPILHLLHSTNEEVHLLAGAALATFAFNSISQQKEIVQSGGVTWGNFKPFLQSTKQSFRVHAAFQLVVLARILPDNEPLHTCATGIQDLVAMLETSTSNDTLALAADCVARLSHTRAGLPAAMVAIDVVGLLCQLLSSPSDQVQGCAAIALSYLSFNHTAERQLLKRCREEPQHMKVLLYYNKKHKWSSSFLERWKHIRELGLPPISSTQSIS